MKTFFVLTFGLLTLALCGCDGGSDKDMVKIISKPGDAQVFINGQPKGYTPSEPGQAFTIKLPKGKHVVSVLIPIDDYAEYRAEKAVTVPGESSQTISLELTKQFTEAGMKKDKSDKQRIAATLSEIEKNMVAIAGGTFPMGCANAKSCRNTEQPKHAVTVSAFEVGKFEVTFAQWDACFDDGGCSHKPDDRDWGRGNRPVINVSWDDITKQYLPWLSSKTGKSYRLPSEAEWEYAARAGSEKQYSWGNSIGKNTANCNGCANQWDGKKTAPVGSFSANKFGLHDLHGNVQEWTQDCWDETYDGATDDATARLTGNCRRRVLRGGSWADSPGDIRAASRLAYPGPNRIINSGFRISRTPNP